VPDGALVFLSQVEARVEVRTEELH
jgi:hypothetical protein